MPDGQDAALAMPFEAAMARLETLVARLDADDTTLEEAVAAYEEAVRLAQHCLDRIRQAEVRVQSVSLE